MEFTDVSQLMFVWRVHVFDVILDRKSPLLSKDIKACGHTYKHTHTETHTDMHIHTHTHRSITIKAVGIKYKDATNLQTLFSLKWGPLFQLQSKDTIFLSNCQICFDYHKTTNIINFLIFFHSVFLCRNGTIHIMHRV